MPQLLAGYNTGPSNGRSYSIVYLPLRFVPVVLCCLLAACTHAPVGAPKAKKLSMLGFTVEVGAQLRQDVLDEYTKRTGIVIDLVPTLGTSSEQTTLILKLLGRQSVSPDLYLIDIIWPGTLAQHMVDLKPYLKPSPAHIPALMENGTVENRIVSLPLYMSTGILYYRSDLLAKYGYSAPPRTWQELQTMANRIQRGEREQGHKDFWGYIWQGAEYEGLTCNALEWQASFGGGHVVERDGSVSVNNPQAVRAFQTASNWVNTIAPPSVLSYTESDSLNAFSSGRAAFMRHWSSAFRSVQSATRGGEVGVAPLPAGPAGPAYMLGGFQLAVSRYSAHRQEAAELAAYLTSPEVQATRAVRRGYLPTYPELYSRADVAAAVPSSGAFRTLDARSWITRPSTATGPKYGAVSKAYYETVHAILSRKAPAAAALADLEQKIQSLVGATSRHER